MISLRAAGPKLPGVLGRVLMAKVIWQKRHRSAYDDIRYSTQLLCRTTFYHIRQVAARVAKLVPRDAFGSPFLGSGNRRGSAMVPFERVMVVGAQL